MHVQAKWYGLSLALHLALFSLMTVLPAKAVKQNEHIKIDLSLEAGPLTASAPSSLKPKGSFTKETSRPATALSPPPVPAPVVQTEKKPVPPSLPAQTQKVSSSPVATANALVNPAPQQSEAQGAGQALSAALTPATVPGRQTNGTAAPASGGEGSLTLEKAKSHYLREHFAYIRNLIMKQLVYPHQARRKNWSGKVTLSFIVNENGNVSAIHVVESSGYSLLDRSAMETVRSVAPFPKPPVSAEIVMPIHFKLL